MIKKTTKIIETCCCDFCNAEADECCEQCEKDLCDEHAFEQDTGNDCETLCVDCNKIFMKYDEQIQKLIDKRNKEYPKYE